MNLVFDTLECDDVSADVDDNFGELGFEGREKSVVRTQQSNHRDSVDFQLDARTVSVRQGCLPQVRPLEHGHERGKRFDRRRRRC